MNANKQKPSNLEIARDAWGAPLPDWIDVLANACDTSSQQKVATAIGCFSNAAISQTLHNKYPGNIENVEYAVRGALMDAEVRCPVMGDINTHRCLDLQTRPLSRMNGFLFVQTHKACRNGCKHFRGEQHKRQRRKTR